MSFNLANLNWSRPGRVPGGGEADATTNPDDADR